MSEELEYFRCSGPDQAAGNLGDGESHIQHESVRGSDEVDAGIFVSPPDNYQALFVERIPVGWGEVGYRCEGQHLELGESHLWIRRGNE